MHKPIYRKIKKMKLDGPESLRHKPSNKKQYTQGKFSPINPHKYKGNPTKIFYRSGYELKFMKWLDKHSSILEWSSEEIVIGYISPKDGRPHRYFPDFLIKKKDINGNIQTVLVEVKPASQTKPPRKSKNQKKYLNEVMTYGINEAKWEAAKMYCKKRNWDFQILTEKELGIKR